MPSERHHDYIGFSALVHTHITELTIPYIRDKLLDSDMRAKKTRKESVHDMDVWAVTDLQEMEEQGPQPPMSAIGIDRKIKRIDQYLLFQELNRLLLDCHRGPLDILLERAAEVGRQVFRFQRATVSLLDGKRALYIRKVLIGYGMAPASHSGNGTVSRETIDRLFSDKRYQVKMVYHKGRTTSDADHLDIENHEKRTLDRRRGDQWESGDKVIVRLKNTRNETFGYIQFDTPEDELIGGRDLFYNLELFGQWTSFAIAHHGQVYALRKQTQRLKQLFQTSNAFKLNYTLPQLFDEIAWGIKNASEFKLVVGGMIGRKSGNLELYGVACDDKIIKSRLLELQFPKKAFNEVCRDEYKRRKSYLVLKQERVFRKFKQVYYGSALLDEKKEGRWPDWGLLILPIRNQKNRMIGFLIADDPADSQLPSEEEIKVLESMGNQFSIAIDNRRLLEMQQRVGELDEIEIDEEPDFQEDPTLYISARMKKRKSRK